MRVGLGYDAHAFGGHRPLVLGGVEIEGAAGLSGWSDADVLSHAVADALLGAAGLGDLGTHFPPEAVAEGTSSLAILARVAGLVAGAGFRVGNVDCVLAVQQVRVAPHRAEMQRRIGAALGLDERDVSVKATTTDRLGFVGRGEGIAAIAVALLEPAAPKPV